MKYSLLLILLYSGLMLKGQSLNEPIEGTVSYITSQSVYVKFANTNTITKGDTLFFQVNNKLVPALVVWDLSSISCVCNPISNLKLKVSDKLVHKSKLAPVIKKEEPLATAVSQAVIHAIDTTHFENPDS